MLGTPTFGVIAAYAENPNYAQGSYFIEDAIRDLTRIIKTWTFGKRLFVLIDDVDRSAPPAAANLIRALGILTSLNALDVVFFIGMDRTIVASALGEQNKDMIPFLMRSDPQFNGTDTDFGLAFAFSFLDKFVNIPFRVPGIESRDVHQLMVDFNASPPYSRKDRHLKHLEELDKHTDSQKFRGLVVALAQTLQMKPRKIKRFVNVCRLSELLINHTSEDVSISQLAKYVAITLRWPLLAEDALNEPKLLAQLQYIADGITDSEVSERAAFWKHDRDLLEVFRVGDQDQDASLATVSASSLFLISRIRLNPSEFFSDRPPNWYWNKTTRALIR